MGSGEMHRDSVLGTEERCLSMNGKISKCVSEEGHIGLHEDIAGRKWGNTPETRSFPHYFKPTPFSRIDIYGVLDLYEVADPCLQHAIKKLLCAGKRGDKKTDTDIEEAIASLKRYQEIRKEEP